ncbi:hypothetical protein B1R94_17660 [Mycolicibacterium litorale]|nr:hypothetical protein B1R94_17660 [Mycolicibacterium litorale]
MMVGQYGIRSRVAIFAGAALGGVYWALLSLLVVTRNGARANTGWIVPSDLLIVIGVNALTLLAGSGLLLLSRPAARTAGLALILCALSGWVVFGTVAIQSWLWRLL